MSLDIYSCGCGLDWTIRWDVKGGSSAAGISYRMHVLLCHLFVNGESIKLHEINHMSNVLISSYFDVVTSA